MSVTFWAFFVGLIDQRKFQATSRKLSKHNSSRNETSMFWSKKWLQDYVLFYGSIYCIDFQFVDHSFNKENDTYS